MFVFEKEQVIHNIGGVRIGGNPGETSTVLAGTIFYSGHKIVTDPKKGTFDKSAATALVQKQDEMSALLEIRLSFRYSLNLKKLSKNTLIL